jgi:FKBP-type peptidyl-prolyl cis-trans isomerase
MVCYGSSEEMMAECRLEDRKYEIIFMNIRESFITLTLAAGCVAANAQTPIRRQPPSAPAPTPMTNSPEEVLKMGSYAWGVGNAQSWTARVPYIHDLDPEEVARGVVEGMRGKLADGSTNIMSLKDASEWIRKVAELSQITFSNKSAAFLAENKKKDGVVTLPDGLQYKVIKEGTGATPTMTNSVKVNYIGKLVNGTEFDNTYNDSRGAATLDMRGVVKGWAEALMLMKEGGKLQAVIPPDLGYGSRPHRSVPANATLVFDLELIAVTNQPPPVALGAPMQAPPPGARVINGPGGGPQASGSGATSQILQVNPDGTHKILPPDATAPAPPSPPVPTNPAKP